MRQSEYMLLSHIKRGNEGNVRDAKELDLGHTVRGVEQNPDLPVPSSLLFPGLGLMVSKVSFIWERDKGYIQSLSLGKLGLHLEAPRGPVVLRRREQPGQDERNAQGL